MTFIDSPLYSLCARAYISLSPLLVFVINAADYVHLLLIALRFLIKLSGGRVERESDVSVQRMPIVIWGVRPACAISSSVCVCI